MFILVAALTYFQKAIFKILYYFHFYRLFWKQIYFCSENLLPPFVVWNIARKKMF
jgi:hypothetical protein